MLSIFSVNTERTLCADWGWNGYTICIFRRNFKCSQAMFIGYLIIGLLAGWIASKIVRGRGSGLIVNLAVGLVGGILGGWLVGLIGWVPMGSIGSLLTSIIGAIVLLWLVSLVTRNVRPVKRHWEFLCKWWMDSFHMRLYRPRRASAFHLFSCNHLTYKLRSCTSATGWTILSSKGEKYRISISHICWKYIRNRVFTVGYMEKNGKVKGFHLYNRGFKRNGFPVISLLTTARPLCLVVASQAL